METRIAIRLDDDELADLDTEVREGRAASRSDALRRSTEYLRREQRYRGEAALLMELAGRGRSVHPELESSPNITHPPID